MRIIFRTDSSLQIGSGHVMRCLTLADELRQRGAGSVFVCREHPGNLISMIEGKGYPVVRLVQSADEFTEAADDVAHASLLGVPWELDAVETIAALDGKQPLWLIVDHYALDHRWEQMLRPAVGKIMVIDDLADRTHDCDLLLDQNLYDGMETRYDTLVSKSCHKLLGPKYALLRPEFAAARKNLRQRDGQVRRVLVFFGGVDPTNETEKALQALTGINDRQFDVDVVVGGGNLHKAQIQKICKVNDRLHFHCQVDNMAELMAKADLAIGAGGCTTWERCFLGLPTIVSIIAHNQAETTLAVARREAIWCLGTIENVCPQKLANAIENALANPSACRAMGENALQLMGTATETSCILTHLFPK